MGVGPLYYLLWGGFRKCFNSVRVQDIGFMAFMVMDLRLFGVWESKFNRLVLSDRV